MNDYVALLKAAKEHVNASVLYKRFINGTPLENDIAVWMADFASDHCAVSEVLEIGDTFHLSIHLPQADVEVDTGLRSPLMRVRDIRRDDAGLVELLAVHVDEDDPVV